MNIKELFYKIIRFFINIKDELCYKETPLNDILAKDAINRLLSEFTEKELDKATSLAIIYSKRGADNLHMESTIMNVNELYMFCDKIKTSIMDGRYRKV